MRYELLTLSTLPTRPMGFGAKCWTGAGEWKEWIEWTPLQTVNTTRAPAVLKIHYNLKAMPGPMAMMVMMVVMMVMVHYHHHHCNGGDTRFGNTHMHIK